MEKDIGKIKKNDTTDIVVRIDDFGGRTGLTIREFVSSERYTGFTKAGVRISSDNFQRFKDMINSVSKEDLAEVSDGSEASTPSAGTSKGKQKKIEDNEEMPDY